MIEDDEQFIDFDDIDTVSDFSVDAICSLASAGVINGYNGKINPHNNAASAETAKMIFEFINKFKRK